MFALIDCNNFYASCERLFRPDLRTQPIVVLSSNDGCVIARSNESKALGIAMGVPFFKIQALCKQHQVHVFSSNFSLYGDLSQRVMMTIEQAWPEVEIYSIDEAFLDLTSMPHEIQDDFCIALQKKILKEIGIPTSIGIGPTKTLAKIANHFSKKIFKVPVFNITYQRETLLKQISLNEIWGIGRKCSIKLIHYGINTAYDLSVINPHILRKQFNVVIMRIAMELSGVACGVLEEQRPRQSIMSSRSFGDMQTSLISITQAVSHHCARAVEKLREQGLVAHRLCVFVYTNRHRKDLAQHCQSFETNFIHATDDVRTVTQVAKKCLRRIFKEGYFYKKTGVCLEELMPKDLRQLDMFQQPSDEAFKKAERFMSAFDAINQKYGSGAVRLAGEGYKKPYKAKVALKSPAYTTQWSELPRVIT